MAQLSGQISGKLASDGGRMNRCTALPIIAVTGATGKIRGFGVRLRTDNLGPQHGQQ
jgi:hypothetical protein